MKLSRESQKPIGVFDSGVGGLTVVRQILRQLPHEQVIYFGDTGRFPYGIRSAEVIRRFSRQNINFLLEQDVKLIVVACNTASAQALDYVKKIFHIPMVGVIEPGARAAAAYTRNKRIGVIGTEGTINSSSYTKALHKINPRLKVFGLPCPLFVALAENGYIEKHAAYLIAEDYLKQMRQKIVDTLVLGCTHYPPLKKVIGRVMGDGVTLVDSADETARSVKKLLHELGLHNGSRRHLAHRFYVSDTPDKLMKLSPYFVGQRIRKVAKIAIDKY